MLIISFLSLGSFLLILQTTLFHFLPAWIGKPDLLFTLIIFLAIGIDAYKGAILALLLGLLVDIFSGIYLGLYPVTYLSLFFILKGASEHLAIDESAHQVPLVVISYIITSSGIFIFASMLAPENDINWSWSSILLQILILSIISVPLFNIYHGLLSFCKKKTKPSFFRRKSGNRFI